MRRILCMFLMIVGTLYPQSIEEQNNIITKNVDMMKKFLYKEYKLKRKYIKREYPNSHAIYFESIEYENYPSLYFSFPISKDEALNRHRYIKVIYSNKVPVEMKKYDKYNIKNNGISYLDKYVKVIETYYNDYDYVMTNYNIDESEDRISCKKKLNKKICTIHRTLPQDKDVINSTHGVMMYSAYPYEMLTGREYLRRIKIKRGEDYFAMLLKQEQSFVSQQIKYYQKYKLKNTKVEFLKATSFIKNKEYIKVFYKNKRYIKAQWYENNELTKSMTFNKKGQIAKLIDFTSWSIKEYKYGRKGNSIDEIECLYLKGTCSVKEVEFLRPINFSLAHSHSVLGGNTYKNNNKTKKEKK